MKYGTNSANFGEIAKGYALRGVYIPKFGPISVKFSVLGVLYPYRCTDGGEIWHGRVDLWSTSLRAKFHAIGATCRPCGAKTKQMPSE